MVTEVRPVELAYAFNGRYYQLAATQDGWLISTGCPGETLIDRWFGDHAVAEAAWRRMLACTIACRPDRLCSAEINGTLLVLVADADGRAHLGELAGPDGDSAVVFTDPVTAVAAWRDRCCELARATRAARAEPICTTGKR
jgi:hypothetical protein